MTCVKILSKGCNVSQHTLSEDLEINLHELICEGSRYIIKDISNDQKDPSSVKMEEG